MTRLFVAVYPPEEVVDLLIELPRKDQSGVRFLPPTNWHITLRFLGDADPDRVIEALNHAELPPTTAHAGPALDLLGTHSVVLPVRGLDDLAGGVEAATGDLGEEQARRRFVGHLTLAKVKRGTIVRKVIGMRCDASFGVNEIALVESRLRPEGAVYDTLARWALR